MEGAWSTVVLLLRLWWQECEARDRKQRHERKPDGAIRLQAHPPEIGPLPVARPHISAGPQPYKIALPV